MHTPRVQVTVRKNWQTDSYEAYWSIFDDRDVPLATGHDTYGPLWEAEQVERLIGVRTEALVREWLRTTL